MSYSNYTSRPTMTFQVKFYFIFSIAISFIIASVLAFTVSQSYYPKIVYQVVPNDCSQAPLPLNLNHPLKPPKNGVFR